jgi:hypothetical protein
MSGNAEASAGTVALLIASISERMLGIMSSVIVAHLNHGTAITVTKPPINDPRLNSILNHFGAFMAESFLKHRVPSVELFHYEATITTVTTSRVVGAARRAACTKPTRSAHARGDAVCAVTDHAHEPLKARRSNVHPDELTR